MNTRVGVRCAKCSSLERTRAVKLVLDHCGAPKKGDRILHFAPEKGLAAWFETVSPDGYEPVDIAPDNYPHTRTRPFDLIADVGSLPSNHYDLIVHLHVLEHIRYFIAPILYHFHRALKPTGLHLFCIPIFDSYYDEYLGPLDEARSRKRFGQSDHVRLFGARDMESHIGSVIKLKQQYSLYDYADGSVLDRCNIPEGDRTGLNGSTVFTTRKEDYLLGLARE